MTIPESGDPAFRSDPPPAPGGLPAPLSRLLRWHDVLWLILIVFLGQLIPGLIVGVTAYLTGALGADADVSAIPPNLVMVAVAGSGVVMLLGAWLLLRARGIDWATIGLRETPRRALAAALLLFIAYVVVAELAGKLLGLDPEGMLARELMNDLVPADASAVYLVLAVLLIGLFVPFAEEVIFRGFLLTWLYERSNAVVAIILSAVGFSVIHFYFVATEFEFGLFVTVQIFVLGLLLAWLTMWSRSLWPAVLLHVVNNVVVVAASVWS